MAEDESVPSILTVTFITSDILFGVKERSSVCSLPLFSAPDARAILPQVPGR